MGFDECTAYCSQPAPTVLNCTVWWGCLQSNGPALSSSHTLTVVTELPMEGAQHHHPKELCIEQYGCALRDKPFCRCSLRIFETGKHNLMSLRTTSDPAMVRLDRPESYLAKLRDGTRHALMNMHMLGIQLPHQSIPRRFWCCSRMAPWSMDRGGCGYTSFFD